METNDENVFKIPTVNKEEEDNHKTQIGEQESDKTEETSSNVQSVPKTVLPEPMTQLVPPSDQYFVDQLKSGVIVDHKLVKKSRIVFGRAQDSDVVLEHPSVSRYHAVLLWSPMSDEGFQSGQNRESFWYLVDCGSTHGTICNKTRITAGKLIKLIPNNNVFRFGASTRLFSLGSTAEDSDEEDISSEESNSSTKKSKPTPKGGDSSGCNWGINEEEVEEAAEETADSKSLQAIIAAMKSTGSDGLQTDNSNAYSSNPNKCIQQWFEREGYELEFKCDSLHNKFKCVIDLPIDGQWIPVEGSLLHKKKEAISDACLKCCQLLDKAELLFPWQQKTQSLRRKQEEDSDSDTDMIDETVKFQNKRKRKDSESNDNSNVDNYETLNEKWTQLNEELRKLRVKLGNIGVKADEKTILPKDSSGDSLDDFMASMERPKYGLSMNDKIEKSKIKTEINVLLKEQQKLEKLIKIAKPSVQFEDIPSIPRESVVNKPQEQPLPPITATQSTSSSSTNESINEIKKPNDEEIDRKSEVKRKTELIINDLKNSSKPKSDSSSKTPKQRHKHQSIVDAIEKEKKLEKSKQSVTFDDDYVDWLPPTDQSGDGKTSLNEKLGY